MANNIKQKIRNPKYLKSDGSFTDEYNNFITSHEGARPDDTWITLNEYLDGDLLVYGKLKDTDAVSTDNIVDGSITRGKLDKNIVDGLEDIKWANLSDDLQKQINSSGGVLIGPKDANSSNDPQPTASAEQKYYAKLWIETEII